MQKQSVFTSALKNDSVNQALARKSIIGIDPSILKSAKAKASVTPKSTKSKVSKKKKKKGKKTKTKKAVTSGRAVDEKNVVDQLVKSPVAANLFLKLMGQDVGDSTDDTKNQPEESTPQLKLPITEEQSEEEYDSESASSDEKEAQPSFTPDHTIQEKIPISVGADPVIIQLPSYSTTRQLQRVFRQQNGRPAPDFTSLTDRGIFIQTDDPKDKGRYFLELITNQTDFKLADTQYFTVVVSDPNDSYHTSSASNINDKKTVSERNKQIESNEANGQIQQQIKASILNNSEKNIWNEKYQGEPESGRHTQARNTNIQTQDQQLHGERVSIQENNLNQRKNLDTQMGSRLSQVVTQDRVENMLRSTSNSPQRRKSCSNAEIEKREVQSVNQEVTLRQFQSLAEEKQHFKTQMTEEECSVNGSEQVQKQEEPQTKDFLDNSKEKLRRQNVQTPHTSVGLLQDINIATSRGLLEATDDQGEQSWEENSASQSSDSEHSSSHQQTDLPELVAQDGTFSKITDQYKFLDQKGATKDQKTQRVVDLENTLKLTQHFQKFQAEQQIQKYAKNSPVKLNNDTNSAQNFAKGGANSQHEQIPSDIRNIRIPSVEHSFSPNQLRQQERYHTETLDTDKFISFSAKQNKNFGINRSPVKQNEETQSQIKNYEIAIKNTDPKILEQANDRGFFSNSSQKYEAFEQNDRMLSHQEKIKQRTERVRDSNKINTQKKTHPSQLVPLQEQRENRRRSRGERANQMTNSASPINLNAQGHRYFKEGPKFSEFNSKNMDSITGANDYLAQSESQIQQSLQSTQQYDALMATLNSIQSESLKQSFQYAAELGRQDMNYLTQQKSPKHQKSTSKQRRKSGSNSETPLITDEKNNESSELNSSSTQNAEITAQAGSHNGKASLQLLIDYNYKKAAKLNQKLRSKIQKVKLQMEVEPDVLSKEFNRGRMEETIGIFDVLHEKEEYEINRQIRLQIEASQDSVRKMQIKLQNLDQERFSIVQATQLETQKTQADEELLLKSYLYDAISQTQNLKLKCNYLTSEKTTLQEKIDALLEQINSTDSSIAVQEAKLTELENEYREGTLEIQQSIQKLQPMRSEIESVSNLNEALTSQVLDFRSQIDLKLQDQTLIFDKEEQINEKQQRLESQIEINSATIVQMNHECDCMGNEVKRVWDMLKQESLILQEISKQITLEQREGRAHQLSHQLEQQQEFLNQQRIAQICAIKQAEIENENWRLEREFQRQKELIKLSQQLTPRRDTQVPVQRQTQMHTPVRTHNRDEKIITTAKDNSEHTPTRSVKNAQNSIFGGNDDLPDSIRYTTTYRQFANNQRFAGKKEGEDGGDDLVSLQQSEASFTRFGTLWDRQEKAPQRKDLSASRERLVNEGQDMAMILRPGSLTPQNNFKFAAQKFLASPVNKKMIAQLPNLREQLLQLQEQRQLEKRSEQRTKLDAQIVFCENRITEIEKKISTT